MTFKHSKLTRASASVSALLCVGMTALTGCEDEVVQAGRGMGGAAPAPAAPAAAPAAGGATGTEATKAKAALAYKDEDFVESMQNRDPFKIYTTAIKTEAASSDTLQRRVYMPTTAVEEMRLIAIITGVAKPKAMLVDPLGVGYVVERGDYVGRPKVVQASGNVAMTLNWRVDRIRENEVVLTQEDAADPTRTALTKIIPLRQELEATAAFASGFGLTK
jgi:Tfp pilus assembly protein PilP